ncbi:MAG: hypothetical protein IPH75_00970 [bacterium]|nr:hypothetical protein [bacterium]
MKPGLSLIAGLLLTIGAVSDGFSQDGVVEIVDAWPIVADSFLLAPVNPQVLIKFTNSTGVPIHTLSTGFKITSLPSVSGRRGTPLVRPYFHSPTSSFDDLFDLEAISFSGSNSADIDTIGFFGRADSTNSSMGMSIGWSDTALVVELGYINYGPTVDRVCIDTCSLPPNRPWRWVNTTVTPQAEFTPSFVGLPYQVYQNGTGPDRIGSGYCWNVRGVSPQPPAISNCPPGTSVVGTPCSPLEFDFDGQSLEGLPYGFGIENGPGTIDPNTGVWSWPTVSNADTGTHQLRVYAMDDGGRGPSATLIVIVNPSPLVDITSGCNTDILLTGVPRDVQMGTSNGACDDNVWSMTQIYGSPSGAYCTLSSTGLISFQATDPGLYEYRVTVTDYLVRDSCNHFFIVHGGPGCCSGSRGNVDGVGSVDLSDLSRLIAYMHNASTVLSCWDEANITGTGTIDLSDLSTLIAYLTVPGSVTFPGCP